MRDRERRWVLIGALLFCASSLGATNGAPKLIDVSHHSGAVDWSLVQSAGFEFAYAKATEGEDLLDPRFDQHWSEMKAAGVARGAYHFYVTEDDPEVQARFFLEAVHHEPGDLTPVVDIEVLGHGTEPGLAKRLRRFLEVVEGELGVKPMLYTSVNFWNEHLDSGFGEYPLWIAEYEVEVPRLPQGWKHWALWQWAEDQTIAGVEKGADVSRFNHPVIDLEQLRVPLLHGVSKAGGNER